MKEIERETLDQYTNKYSKVCSETSLIDISLYEKYGVKRGLRDQNGKGVVTGITSISSIKSHEEVNGKSIPCEGELLYRGYNIIDLIKGFVNDKRYGFEETTYLLLFSKLPTESELTEFKSVLNITRELPKNFVRDVIMKAPSKDIMNSLTKSILTLASYDENVSDLSLDNVLKQCLMLISIFPMLAVYGYHAYNHYEAKESFYIHRPDENLSTAENILRMLRPDTKYTALEASVLDTALMLHMEHGGGNNSTFTTRVVSSSGSDTYSVISAALSSLKGGKHGGANIKVVEMMEDIKSNVNNINDEDQIRAYLKKMLNKEVFDKRGLIYGMGHAVYTISDPRATVFKGFVEKLAIEKSRDTDFKLYSIIERLAPEVIAEERNIYKGVSANVDFYSGFVYSMLDIPLELYTPIFAMARIVGWSAHRLEELINTDKIIRPAYESIVTEKLYKGINER
ncbi:citrate/2-methylcitrate synthase [Clostridium sp. UBA1652]|uniref:citrate/2-methylcitrate synthase n=1 Tax=Clostridium sp. UBA1652 TaxID=1946348 RepID=UPI00257E6EAD|nr:citrate/2-methylcitrate synthase [Clostridium sp. UBA1652]